jgi:hypothetical protein
MSNLLRNRVKSSNESRRKYSSNFVMDQLLKQKFYEIQKMFSINSKPEKRERKNEV